MSKTQRTTVTVFRVERGNSSRYGNPSYVFKTSGGEYRTQTDAMLSYGLPNDFDGARWRHFNDDGDREWLDMPVTVEFEHTPAGRVVSYRIVGAEEGA